MTRHGRNPTDARVLTRALLSVVLLATACAVPGLGEIMAATQMRHLKLWYAGQAEN